jgi:hypothetical protein
MSNKSRFNKLRKIIIEGSEYFWVVNHFNCDGDGGCSYKIWSDKKVIFDDVTYDTITPKIVREKILSLNKLVAKT